METKDFYTSKEVEAMFNLSSGTIRKYINLGQLKADKVGNSYIIKPEYIAEWEKTRKPRKKVKKDE